MISVTAIGTVPADGWSKVRLKPLYEPNHPPGVLALELVALAPPHRKAATAARQEVSATAQVPLPPGTRLIYVMAGVNDDAKTVPGYGPTQPPRSKRRRMRKPPRQ